MCVGCQAIAKAMIMDRTPSRPLLDIAPNGERVAFFHGTDQVSVRHGTLDGVAHGGYWAYHSNGTKATEGMYSHNKRHGDWTRFNEDGKPIRWYVWNHGELVETGE